MNNNVNRWLQCISIYVFTRLVGVGWINTEIDVLIYTRVGKFCDFWFWRPLKVTVRPMPQDRCPVRPVCNVSVLWPNGWIDQDAILYRGRPRSRPHCVRWGPSSPAKRGTTATPLFGPCLLWPNGRPSHQLLSAFWQIALYVGNGIRYGYSHYGLRRGNSHAIYRWRWPWVYLTSPNSPFWWISGILSCLWNGRSY